MKASISKYIAYFLMMLMLVGNTGLSLTTVLCACHGKIVYAAKPQKACCSHEKENVPYKENIFTNNAIALAHTAPIQHCTAEGHQHTTEQIVASSHLSSSKHKCCNQQVEYIHIDKAQEFKYTALISCECENHDAHDLDCFCCSWDFLAWNFKPIYYAPAHPIWQLAPLDYNYLAQAPPRLAGANTGRFIINKIQNYRC